MIFMMNFMKSIDIDKHFLSIVQSKNIKKSIFENGKK